MIKFLMLFLCLNVASAQKFVDLKSGEKKEFKNLKSDEIYVDLWATWCMPCRKSLPVLDSISNANKYLIIALNTEEEQNKVKNFIERYKLNLRVWFNPGNEWVKSLEAPALPSLYVVDKNGKVLRKLEAYNEDQLREFFK